MIVGLNHINLAVSNMETSFHFYKNIVGLTPLCRWEGSAYFLAGPIDSLNSIWVCLDLDRDHLRKPSPCYSHVAFRVNDNDFDAVSKRIIESNTIIFKENKSFGKSLYFLDPDHHKLEIHVGTWQERIAHKKENLGNWKNVEWFV